MRKRCLSCGLICFVADESCKRCDSIQLQVVTDANHSSNSPHSGSADRKLSPNRLKYFFFAVGIELIALILSLPALGEIGMHHSSNAPSSMISVICGIVFLVTHFPTLYVNIALMLLTRTEIFLLLTPITQIAFWTYILAKLNH